MQPATDIALALINGIGRTDFAQHLTRALKRHIAFDAGLVLLYRHDGAPKILFNEWQTGQGMSDLRDYVRGAYRLDPFYKLAIELEDDGLYRLSQIAPSYEQTRYYREYYQFSGLKDEFNFVITLDQGMKIAFSLCRRTSGDAFSGEDTALLESIAPLVRDAVVRHFRDLRPDTLEDDGHFLRKALTKAVESFGRSVLTDRECQVAQLILRGYSLKGAAEKLGISPATVKLHRRNLYAKLDVNSQTALFSLFIDSVSSSENLFKDPLSDYLAVSERAPALSNN